MIPTVTEYLLFQDYVERLFHFVQFLLKRISVFLNENQSTQSFECADVSLSAERIDGTREHVTQMSHWCWAYF